MTEHNNNFRSLLIAASAASVMMFGFGLAYYAIAVQLPAAGTATPINPNALEPIPLQIGDWKGENVPMDPEMMVRTGTDAFIHRCYRRADSAESVILYVACGCNVAAVISHRPEICYVNSGWTLVNRRLITLPSGDDGELSCTVFKFSRSRLHKERILTLNYFVVGGQHCRDYSSARAKAGYRFAEVNYATQVQISTSISAAMTPELAEKTVSSFAADIASSVARLSEEFENGRKAAETDEVPSGN